MSDIKRWRTEDDHYRPVEFVADDGPWVDYDDHAAAMQTKDATIEQLQARIVELEKCNYRLEQMAEEADCLNLNLDKAGVPRDVNDAILSLWGRVVRYAKAINN